MMVPAILFTGVQQVALGTAETPERRQDEVLVRAVATCISPGTELRCLAGLQPDLPAWPFVPGYAMAGVVEEGPSEWVGRRVLCGGSERLVTERSWGGQMAVGLANVRSLVEIPDGIGYPEAAAVKMFGIAHRGLVLAQPQPGERVAVLGLGMIGHLSARLFHATGADVTGIDGVPERRALLEQAGIRSATLADVGEEFDIVVDATGSNAATMAAIGLAKPKPWIDGSPAGARLVIQGSYAGDLAFDYHAAFRKELTIHVPRNVERQDMESVFAMAVAGRLSLDGVVSHLAEPHAAPEVYRRLREEKDWITAAFRWN